MDGLLWFILIGLIVGRLAGVLVKGGSFGVLGDIVFGIPGEMLEDTTLVPLELTRADCSGRLFAGTFSATIIIFNLGLFTRA